MNSENSEISRLEQSNTLGLAFVRTMVTLNGGAILALLTFIGNANAQTAISVSIDTIKIAMLGFIIGLASILFALLISYSFTASAPETKYSQFWNNWIVTFNSICSLICLLSFLFGVLSILCGVEAK